MRVFQVRHPGKFPQSVVVRCTATPTNAGSSRKLIALERARTYYEVRTRTIHNEVHYAMVAHLRKMLVPQEVWSQGKLLKLTSIMADAHEQHDMVWQPSRVGVGRDAMTRGIVAYRSAYPDLTFRVQDASYSEQSHSVYVAWTARGTNLGPIRDRPPTDEVAEFSGITQLLFNNDDQITASYVYRQAVAAEARYFLGLKGLDDNAGSKGAAPS